MQAAVRASLSVKMDIPIYVLMPTLANLFVRDLELCGSWMSVLHTVANSVTAQRLRDRPAQTLAELTVRLEGCPPGKVQVGLTQLLLDVVGILGIVTPKDIHKMSSEHLVEWFKWVGVWFGPST